MTYQALLIGPCCAVFSCLAVWVIPLVFGEEWLPSIQIFPFVATGILVSSVFDLHSSTLYAIGHNRQVAKLNLCYVGVLWLVAAIALQTLGLWGYGIAEIAALPSFFVIHRSLSKTFGSPDYSNALWIVIATLIPLYGSIFLAPMPAIGLLIASYTVLILLNAKIRVLPSQLLTTVRSR
jgi:PST family polysaccharide transporter